MSLSFQTLIGSVVHSFAGSRRTSRQRRVVIVGAEQGQRLLAGELSRCGERVSIVEVDPELCSQAGSIPSLEVFRGDPLGLAVLRQARIDEADFVLVAMLSDELTMTTCQLIEMNFNPSRLVARVIEQRNIAEFEVLGYEVMSLAKTALTILREPRMTIELRELLKNHDADELLAEVLVASPVMIGRSMSAILKHGCEILELTRSNRQVQIDEETSLQVGDLMTLFGTRRAIDTVRAHLSSQC